MQPVIGISTRPKALSASGGELGTDTLQHTYRDAVLAAGGLPILLAPVPDEQIDALLDLLHGLVLTGGGDVHPGFYDSVATDEMFEIHESRDVFEFALARRAAERSLPTLAICRGLQVINVAFGGSLIEDIPSEVGTEHAALGSAAYERFQLVRLTPDSTLATLYGETELKVNSIHHQSIRKLATGFREVGWAEDGVIEAIETESDWPLLAVQWHPEYLLAGGHQDARVLFDELLRLAAG